MIRGLSQMNVKTMIYGLLKVATVIILSPNKNDFTKILAAGPYINNKRRKFQNHVHPLIKDKGDFMVQEFYD